MTKYEFIHCIAKMKTVAQKVPIRGGKIGLLLGLSGTLRGRDPTAKSQIWEKDRETGKE